MSVSKKTRFEIFSRDKFTCRYCGRNSEDATLEVDHVVPRSKGGSDDPANLVTSCFDCNRGKSDSVLESVPTVDFLAMAQEMREQERVSKLLRAKARKDLRTRGVFQEKVLRLANIDNDNDFDHGTMATLYSFTKEFGAEIVLGWVAKAIHATGGHRSTDIGRYVSGIRRKVKEGA